MCAIEQAVLMAKGLAAMLVPVSLVHVPARRRAKGARLEDIQQSKDFLEAAKYKAGRFAVPVERLEVFTEDVVQSINTLASEMECEGILLFVGHKGGILLEAEVIKRLMETAACKLYIVRLPSRDVRGFARQWRRRFSNWLSGKRRPQGELPSTQRCSAGSEERVPLPAKQ